jgi:hypothetical protein
MRVLYERSSTVLYMKKLDTAQNNVANSWLSFHAQCIGASY